MSKGGAVGHTSFHQLPVLLGGYPPHRLRSAHAASSAAACSLRRPSLWPCRPVTHTHICCALSTPSYRLCAARRQQRRRLLLAKSLLDRLGGVQLAAGAHADGGQASSTFKGNWHQQGGLISAFSRRLAV